MPKSSDLFFVSSNVHKYNEAKKILDCFGIKLGFLKSKLEEIQSNSLDEIARKKAQHAFSKYKTPLIIEDDGLFIDALGGFPGPYSSYVFKTIGNNGILDLLTNHRCAKFISVITFCDGEILESFSEKLPGFISKSQMGNGWGFDPIFVPNNTDKTFAETVDKNELSHRYKSLKKFANWYLHK